MIKEEQLNIYIKNKTLKKYNHVLYNDKDIQKL